MRGLNWKTRWFLSILGAVLSVVLLLFGGTYYYFVQRLTSSNEKIVRMSFQETEENLRILVKNAELQLAKFSNSQLVWQYAAKEYGDGLEASIGVRKIIEDFDQVMYADANVYGVAILRGDGEGAVSTAERKSRTGKVEVGERLQAVLAGCKEQFPYVVWISGEELGFSEQSPLHCLVNRPVLLGIKAMGEAESWEEDCFLLMALDETKVRQSYKMVSYNGSRTVLTDETGKILSATEEGLIGSRYGKDPKDQNIEYELSYNRWRLVNMIPREEYLSEARGIRTIGLFFGGLAGLFVIFFCMIWNRKYTAPIQILMNQMEMVGRENLEIGQPKAVGWPELDHLNSQFYETVQKLKDYIARLQTAEQEKAREELLALQYQINPHFLYNSLNSIRWMAMMTNNTKVADSLVVLSKIITPILRNPSFTWKLRDELEFLDNYVKMMRIRFGSSMEYHLECGEEILEETFPRFILQPALENCFVHGSSGEEIHHIYVRIRKHDRFAIEIQNTGVFLDEERLNEINGRILRRENDGKSIGLSNIRKRLNLMYGENGQIWMESSRERGVLVYICF